jgi:hypothetical protein
VPARRREGLLEIDIEEAANLARPDVRIESIVMNQWGDTVALFAGALKPTRGASGREARSCYLTRKAVDKDIVIANTYGRAEEWVRAFEGAESVKSSGADFVLVNASDGLVVR